MNCMIVTGITILKSGFCYYWI